MGIGNLLNCHPEKSIEEPLKLKPRKCNRMIIVMRREYYERGRNLEHIEIGTLTTQAEYVLPSLVSFQQPPLLISQRKAPEAVQTIHAQT